MLKTTNPPVQPFEKGTPNYPPGWPNTYPTKREVRRIINSKGTWERAWLMEESPEAGSCSSFQTPKKTSNFLDTAHPHHINLRFCRVTVCFDMNGEGPTHFLIFDTRFHLHCPGIFIPFHLLLLSYRDTTFTSPGYQGMTATKTIGQGGTVHVFGKILKFPTL